MKRTVVLIILDGWGLGGANESNPIYAARLTALPALEEHYPVTSLQASGIAVGLPWGEVGNSEVGHLSLGAGKVVYQYFPRITMAIEDGTFFKNEVLKRAFAHARERNSSVNLVGLLTAANVHASQGHLEALLVMAKREDVDRVNLHLFADGKDSPPRSVTGFLKKVPKERLATLIGRYYAMDRNQNWQLTEKAYGCLVGQSGKAVEDPAPAIAELTAKGLSEEYLPPLRLTGPVRSSASSGAGGRPIADGDAIIFFNFREDSIRQLFEAFTVPGFDKFPTAPLNDLSITTLTRYEETSTVPVAFPPDPITKPLGLILADLGKTQLRIAESYKYAHVTYFFNGYREPPYQNEYRVIIPSMNLVHPDEHPELQARAITDRLVEAIGNQAFDFVLANYSNPDTIGHTGNFDACVEAAKIIDREVGRLVAAAAGTATTLIITSDHGNLEEVVSPVTGMPETQHDSSPVPFYLVGPAFKGKKFTNWRNLATETTGILADVAPTILELMDIPKPDEMTGESLLRNLIK